MALLAACSADKDEAQSSSDTASATTSEPGSTTSTSTADAASGEASSAGPVTDASSSAPTSTDSTGATSSTDGTSGTSSTSGEVSGTSTEASSTGMSTEAGTTGPDGVLGAAALDAMDALEQAVEGVTYPSESDYPWVVVGFADAAPVSAANVKDVIAGVYVPHEGQASLADRTIEPRTLAQLFDPLTTPQDWWEANNFMVAAQYTEIRAVLEGKLVDIQVFRIGEKQGNVLLGAVDIYVLGATADGDVVGMWTVSIET